MNNPITLEEIKTYDEIHRDLQRERQGGSLRGRVKRHSHKCKSCGFPIHPSCTYCGECLCEEDGL